jgi:hypothetical protein
MLPNTEFFNLTYMQKKKHKFARTPVRVKTQAELDESIISCFVKFIIEADAKNMSSALIVKVKGASKDIQDLFAIAVNRVNLTKGCL